MDTARAAEMSHRECNPSFVRRWTGPPPPKRRNPGRDPGAVIGKLKLNIESVSDIAVRAAQRAIETAERRAAQWDRLADDLRALGYWLPADRLRRQATGLRAAVSV